MNTTNETAANPDVVVLKPSEIIDSLELLMAINEPAMLEGQPGIGKTALVHQFGERVGRRVMETRLAISDPVDLRGLPVTDPKTGTTKWLTPDEFPRDDCEPTIWFFDEWGQGTTAVQNTAGQALYERRIGGYRVPDQIYICAAQNRAQDRAGTNRIPAHVRDRFCKLQVAIDADEWCKHMLKVGCAIEIIAFIRYRADLLAAFDPNKDSPTPRGMERCSEILKQKPAKNLELALFAGKIGQAAALELTGFLRVFRQMVNPDAVLINPDRAEIPEEPSALMALTTALARRAKPDNLDRIVTYLNRIPQRDFGVGAMKRTIDGDATLQNTNAFIRWAAENSDVLF